MPVSNQLEYTLIDLSFDTIKASLREDGSMHWRATCSETTRDKAGEATSLALFQDWIERIEKSLTVPYLPPPRMPFLGISHYPSLDGYGEAGPSRNLYIDGRQFKAAGMFYNDPDHPLGQPLFKAIYEERKLIERGGTVKDPLRISAAWWNIQHAHNGGQYVFTRRSIEDECPMCQAGDHDIIYLQGQLDHFAVTRVPMHPATSITAFTEKSMTTQLQDAKSIIGEDEAEELERKKQKLIGKSEANGMVVKAKDKNTRQFEEDVEDEEDKELDKDREYVEENTKPGKKPVPDKSKAALTKTVDGEEFGRGDFLVVGDPEKVTTWHLPVKRGGKLDHKLMGAARAALGPKGFRGNRYEGPDKEAALAKLKKLYAAEEMEWTAKADMPAPQRQRVTNEDVTDEDLNELYDIGPTGQPVAPWVRVTAYRGDMMDDDDYEEEMVMSPFGGAMSLDGIDEFEKRQSARVRLMSNWEKMMAAYQNIERFAPEDQKLDLLKSLMDSTNKRVQAIKSRFTDVALLQPEQVDSTPVDPAVVKGVLDMQTSNKPEDQFRAALDAVKSNPQLDRNAKLLAAQEALNQFGMAVKAELDQANPPNVAEVAAQAAVAAITPFIERMDLILARYGQPQAPQLNQMPVQRSIPQAAVPQVGQQQQATQQQQAGWVQRTETTPPGVENTPGIQALKSRIWSSVQ